MSKMIRDIRTAMDEARRAMRGAIVTRVRVSPEAYQELMKLVDHPDHAITRSSMWGVPIVVDEQLPVRWRMEFDGPVAL